MKKSLLTIIAVAFPLAVNAQMSDTMGALAIDGMLHTEAYQGIGQMQNALGKVNFQQDLSELITETQIVALNGYFDKSNVRFDGLKGVDWDVVSVATGQYYIEVKNLSYSDCFTVKNSQWGTHHTEINNGAEDCKQGVNNAKLFF